jgi:hypothetical protein
MASKVRLVVDRRHIVTSPSKERRNRVINYRVGLIILISVVSFLIYEILTSK